MCIFCEISNGRIPCYKLYEDDICISFLDLSQATIGHALVVPKKHYSNIFEIPSDEYKHICEIVQKLAFNICDKLKTNNVNILNNNGPIAGQTVNHFHIHIIPRYENDNVEFIFANNKLEEKEFIDLANKIKLL